MPFRRLEIHSPLPVATVRERIQQRVRSTRAGFWESLEAGLQVRSDELPFKGEVFGHQFKIMRAIRYRNSFLPVIYGTISPGVGGGTLIKITMRLHLFAAAFWIVWVGLSAASVPWSSLHSIGNQDATDLVPLGILLFGILLPPVGFYPEAKKAERIIRDAVCP